MSFFLTGICTGSSVLLFHQAHLLFPRVCPEHTFCGVQDAVPPSIRPPRLYAYARFDKVCLSVPRFFLHPGRSHRYL